MWPLHLSNWEGNYKYTVTCNSLLPKSPFCWWSRWQQKRGKGSRSVGNISWPPHLLMTLMQELPVEFAPGATRSLNVKRRWLINAVIMFLADSRRLTKCPCHSFSKWESMDPGSQFPVYWQFLPVAPAIVYQWELEVNLLGTLMTCSKAHQSN